MQAVVKVSQLLTRATVALSHDPIWLACRIMMVHHHRLVVTVVATLVVTLVVVFLECLTAAAIPVIGTIHP